MLNLSCQSMRMSKDAYDRLPPNMKPESLISAISAKGEQVFQVMFDSQPTTDESKLNSLERRYLSHLRSLRLPWIGIQCITVKLGDDCRLTPDFWTVSPNGEMEAHDTKAFNKKRRKVLCEDDALVKLKVAARMYRFFKWFIVYEDGGMWVKKPVNP